MAAKIHKNTEICVNMYLRPPIGDINVLYDISSTSCMVSWYPVAMSTLAIVAVTMFTFHAAKILSDMEER